MSSRHVVRDTVTLTRVARLVLAFEKRAESSRGRANRGEVRFETRSDDSFHEAQTSDSASDLE